MSDDVLPFGKYKGMTVIEVAQRDPQYLQWLQQQNWFIERFSNLNLTINVNQFGPPNEDTPEHNRLVACFFEDRYRDALAYLVFDLPTSFKKSMKQSLENGVLGSLPWYDYDAYFHREGKKIKLTPFSKFGYYSGYSKGEFKNYRRQFIKKYWDWRKFWRQMRNNIDLSFDNSPWTIDISSKSESETDSIDVLINCNFLLKFNKENTKYTKKGRIALEIKPSLGDDFSAVLRNMKKKRNLVLFSGSGRNRNESTPYKDHSWILVIDQFAATNVSFEQVKNIFKSDDIRIIMMSDIEKEVNQRFPPS